MRAAHPLPTASDRRPPTVAGITTAQLGALVAVRDEPGLSRRGTALAPEPREYAVTTPVGRLTAGGLVTRRAHPREHRAVVVELTERGAAAVEAEQPEVDRFDAEARTLLGGDGFAHRGVPARAGRRGDGAPPAPPGRPAAPEAVPRLQ